MASFRLLVVKSERVFCMRLFFAYWPSPGKAAEIVPWVDSAHALYGGRPMRTDTLHMTLAFLGPADAGRIRALTEACVNWRLPTGPMVLREPGCFRNAKVVWLGPESSGPSSPPWLHAAHDQLWSHLAPLGWPASGSAFRPHVSLLRNARPADLSALRGPPVCWTPERCVLVASTPAATRSRYTMLAEIPLRPEAP